MSYTLNLIRVLILLENAQDESQNKTNFITCEGTDFQPHIKKINVANHYVDSLLVQLPKTNTCDLIDCLKHIFALFQCALQVVGSFNVLC